MNTARRHRPVGRARMASTTTSCLTDGRTVPVRLRSMVGLIPLCAARSSSRARSIGSPASRKRMQLVPREPPRSGAATSAYMQGPERNGHDRRLLAIPSRDRLERVLSSDARRERVPLAHGIRSLSRVIPRSSVLVCPSMGSSTRSRTRRPNRTPDCSGQLELARSGVGSPNALLIEALERYYHFYGETYAGGVSDRIGPADEPSGGGPRDRAAVWRPSSSPMRAEDARVTAPMSGSGAIRAGTIWCFPRVLRRRQRARRRRQPPDADGPRSPRAHIGSPRWRGPSARVRDSRSVSRKTPGSEPRPCPTYGSSVFRAPPDRSGGTVSVAMPWGPSTASRTRRYHGLLIHAATPPTGRVAPRQRLRAWVELDGHPSPITSQRYAPDVVIRDGASRLSAFSTDPWPSWTFDLGEGLRLNQELFVRHGQPLCLLRWRLSAPTAAARHGGAAAAVGS